MTRVGVIGAGPMGRLHAQTVHRLSGGQDSFRVARLLDRHHGRAEALAQELGAKPSASLEAFIDQVDVAIVAAPTFAHFELSRALLEGGLDVLVEKPLASKIAEGEALVAAAEAGARILQVGHVEWFNPAWREASLHVGAIRRIEVDRCQPPSERGRDIDVVEDLMLHDLDWTTRLVGQPVVDIIATGRIVGGELLDEVEAEIRFEGGCVARLRSSRVDEVRRREVSFIGDGGRATANLDLPGEAREDIGAGSVPKSDDPMRASPRARGGDALKGRDPLESQWLEFADACRTRRQSINHGRVGVDALRLVERVRDAVARNRGGSGRDHDSRLRG